MHDVSPAATLRLVTTLSNVIFSTGTTDPAFFDWMAFIVLPAVVGVATIVIAAVAIIIAVQANGRANAATARQTRTDFGQTFLRYTQSPSYSTAMAVKWPEALMEDPAVARIPDWYQEQLADSRLTAGLLETSIETRLIEWVKTAKFRDEPIMSPDGSMGTI